jgi:ABC-type antimicrobial peptide transport system permease subunit
MRSQLAAIPNVVSVTGTDMNMGRGRDNSASTSILGFEYKGKTVKTSWRRVDFDYTKTLGLKLLSGRDFSRTFGADTNSVLINEKMAAQLGEPNPVGKIIPMNEKKYLIAGLVKDFNFQSLHEKIMPLTMMMLPNWSVSYIFVRVKAGDLPGSMASVTKAWKQINPKAEFDPSFLDENVDKQYRSEDRLSKIFISGAVVAIIISCMGLFAIALLVIAQRTKEIGIRKVLGANVITIVALISRDFLKLIAVAVLIASPIAWYLMNKWLRDFAYRITVSGWIFVITGITILFVALATVGLQTVKAALVNPVKSLKSE